MNISPITFGQKIPTINCKVKNNETGKYVPATLYEYDCKDIDDIKEIEELPKSWSFKDAISNGMRSKKAAKEKYNLDMPNSFYVLKTTNNEIIGISYLYRRENDTQEDKSIAVKFIQTSPDRTHKYAGQAMLAGHALTAINDGYEKFEVRFATDEATPFYIYKCGFKRSKDKYSLEMKIKDVKKFLIKMLFRTHGKIEDIRG